MSGLAWPVGLAVVSMSTVECVDYNKVSIDRVLSQADGVNIMGSCGESSVSIEPRVARTKPFE